MTSRSLLRLPVFATGLLGMAALAAAQQKPAAPAPSVAPAASPAPAAPAAPFFKTERERVGYAIGAKLGHDLSALKEQGIDADTKTLIAAVSDTLTGATLKMSDREIQETLLAVQAGVDNRRNAKMKATGDVNKKEGDDYLAANKAKEGVKTTASGLQYKVLKDGTGPIPKATDVVSVHYRGTFVNGTEFDSSYKRNEPAEFPVNGVIPGWTEALQMMKVGSKYQLAIPASVAYGEPGRGPIPPNSTLLFDIELLGIKGQK